MKQKSSTILLPTKPTKKKKSTKKKKKSWLVTSEQYKRFAALCEKHEWDKRDDLPKLGSRSIDGVDELVEIQKAGMGDGHEFTRTQLNNKFHHWKGSLESERKVRVIDENKIDITKNLVASKNVCISKYNNSKTNASNVIALPDKLELLYT